MKKRLVLATDDARLAELLRATLAAEGYELAVSPGAGEARLADDLPEPAPLTPWRDARGHAFGEIARAITSLADLDEVLRTIMEKAKEVVDADASTLFLLDEAAGDLEFRVAHGDKGDRVKSLRIKVGEGVAGFVAQTRRPLIVADAYADPRFDSRFDKLSGFTTRTILCAPLILRERLVGVVQAVNKAADENFSGEDLEIFTQFASFAAIAIENSRVYQKVVLEKTSLEQRLKAFEVQVDETEKVRQVKAITDSDEFQALRLQAERLRSKG